MKHDPGCGTSGNADPSMAGGFADLPRGQHRLALAGVILAVFLSVLSQTILTTAMPAIVADLGGFHR